MQQTLIGGGVRFSYCTGNDIQEISRMLSKESVCRWMFFGPNTEETTRSYFLPLIDEIESAHGEGKMPKNHVFTMRLENSGEFIGQCALFAVDFSPGSFQIGYQIDDTYWGKGYGSLACAFLVYFAFSVQDGYRLNGDTFADNAASGRVMEKCGFVREGVQRRYWHVRGEYYDRVIFGLLKSDLKPKQILELEEMFAPLGPTP